MLLAAPLVALNVCSTAAAQDAAATSALPLCPAGEAAITVAAPSTVQQATSYSVTFARAGANVASVDVEFVAATRPGEAPTSTSETFSFAGSNEVKVVRVAPAALGTFDVNVSWVQDPGSPAACRGSERRAGIPIVGPGVRAGEPSVGRFEGKYRVKRSDGGKPSWTLTPRCDLFACTSALRSNRGLKGDFTLDAGARKAGEYRFKQRYVAGSCDWEYDNGSTVTWREFATTTIKLRPTKVVDGVATELRGIERVTYDVPSDQYHECGDSPTETTRIVATLR